MVAGEYTALLQLVIITKSATKFLQASTMGKPFGCWTASQQMAYTYAAVHTQWIQALLACAVYGNPWLDNATPTLSCSCRCAEKASKDYTLWRQTEAQ